MFLKKVFTTRQHVLGYAMLRSSKLYLHLRGSFLSFFAPGKMLSSIPVKYL